jgi:hypothetical protein
VVVHACHPSYAISINRIVFQASPGIKRNLISKITNTKRVEGMAQVVEHLPSKHKAPSLTTSNKKKKKGRKGGEERRRKERREKAEKRKKEERKGKMHGLGV